MDVECIDLIDSDEDEKKNVLHGQIFGNDQMIRCNLCLDPGLLPVEEDRAAHRTAVHADKLFYCDACEPHEKGGRGFENFDEVVKHVCKENGIQRNDTRNVWDMIRIPKNVDGLKIFTCLFCSGEGMKFVGMKEDNFLEHIRTQHGKAARRRPEKLHRECRICNESFENDIDLTEHVQTYIYNVTKGSSKIPKFVGFGQRLIDDYNDTSEDDMTIVEEPRGKRKKAEVFSSCSDDEVVLKKKKKSKKAKKKNKERIEDSHRTSTMPLQVMKPSNTKDDLPAMMSSIRDIIIRCIFCSEKVVDLNEHLFLHHSYQCFQCAVCSKSKLFIDIDLMLKHSREIHSYRTPLEQGKIILPRHLALISCGFCDPPEIFIGKEIDELRMNLFQHLEMHENIHRGKDEIIEKKVLHNCRLCPDRDFPLADLDSHIAKHCVVESSSPGPSVSRQPKSSSPRISSSRRPLSPVSSQHKSSRRPTSPHGFIDHGRPLSPRYSSSKKRSQSPRKFDTVKRHSQSVHSANRRPPYQDGHGSGRPPSPDHHASRRPQSPGHHSSRRPKSPEHLSSTRPASPNFYVSMRPPSVGDHRSSRRPQSPEFQVPGKRKSDHYEPSKLQPSPIHHGSRRPGSSGDYRFERPLSPGNHRSHGDSRRTPSPAHHVPSPDMHHRSSRKPSSPDNFKIKRHSSPSFHGSRKPLSPGSHRSSRRPSPADHHSSRRPQSPPHSGSRRPLAPIHHESPKHDRSNKRSHSPGYYGSKIPSSSHHGSRRPTSPQSNIASKRPPSPHSHRSSRKPRSPESKSSPGHYGSHKIPHSPHLSKTVKEYEPKDKGIRDDRRYESGDHKKYHPDEYRKSRQPLDDSSRSKYDTDDKEKRRPSYSKNDFKMPSELKPIKDSTPSNSNENFDCRYCGDSFVTLTEAENHLKKHHEEKLGEEFEQADLLACLILPKELQEVSCKFCDMKTMIGNDIKPVLAKLRGHKMESHQEEGCSILTCFSVACRVCNLRYEDISHSNDMNSHVATHSKGQHILNKNKLALCGVAKRKRNPLAFWV